MLASFLFLYAFFFLSLFFTNYSFIPKLSINNLVLPFLVLTFLLAADIKINKSSLWIHKLQNISERKIVVVLCFFIFTVFFTVNIVRHLSFNTGAFDLAIFDQGIWNTAQGKPLFCTVKWIGGGSLLGDHFEPILFLIAPLYKLHSDVFILLFLQSFLLASALVPLYLISKSILKNRFLIFCILICYVISKPVRGVVFSDFHPESFIVPALFWGYYALTKRNNALLWTSIVVLLLSKEDATFLTLSIGLYAIVDKRKWLGIFIIILSGVSWWVETAFLIPYFSPTHTYAYLNKMPFGSTYLENRVF